ncbi:MAG: dephospho-CoA kinase [Sphingobacteriales bacterium]|nr:MAG: dephospho-CoA kinase [Sphingobacteriales bacterium]
MLTIGVTGGIGSGKTTVCRIFEVLGSPVFYADAAAREVMETNLNLRRQIIELLGPETYPNGVLDRKAIAAKVFGVPELLEALNALVHPATALAWQQFQEEHSEAPYLLKEAAILFESGAHTTVQQTICVTAPEALRLARAMARDNVLEEAIRSRMARQLSEAERNSRCDFVIVNDDVQALLPQVLQLDARFRNER